MQHCKKCGKPFEIPENCIEMAFAIYCKPCIKLNMQKIASLSDKEYVALVAKSLFNVSTNEAKDCT